MSPARIRKQSGPADKTPSVMLGSKAGDTVSTEMVDQRKNPIASPSASLSNIQSPVVNTAAEPKQPEPNMSGAMQSASQMAQAAAPIAAAPQKLEAPKRSQYSILSRLNRPTQRRRPGVV